MPVAAFSMIVAMGLAASTMNARATRDRPPPAHTGGFGEPTCQSCHDDLPANRGPGTLRITGIHDGLFHPGQAYDLHVELEDLHLRAAGFQLTARFRDGSQAGQFEVPSAETGRIAATLAGGIVFMHHLYDGTEVATRGAARWSVRWLPPEGAGGTVVLHAAAVAADNDLSNLGDNVYTAELLLRPASPR
jgi:hypothetical protein